MKSGACRVATIDIGTNSVLLLVAEFSPAEPRALRAVAERCTITRLGQDVDRTRRLHPDAVARTLACLQSYQQVLQDAQVQALEVVATSASRDAGGAPDFVQQASRILGVAPRVIDGPTEARLTFEGALLGLPVAGPVLMHDIGGGSTELVTGAVDAQGPVVHACTSLDLGSVRLTERHFASDPPLDDHVEQACAEISRALRPTLAPGPHATVVGVAGTVTTLAAITLGLTNYDPSVVHGYRLRLDQVEACFESLRRVPLEQRRTVVGLEPKRADVIVAGALLCREILRWAGCHEMVASDRGVRWGLALEAASKLCERTHLGPPGPLLA